MDNVLRVEGGYVFCFDPDLRLWRGNHKRTRVNIDILFSNRLHEAA